MRLKVKQKLSKKENTLYKTGYSEFKMVETGESRTPRPEEATQSMLQA